MRLVRLVVAGVVLGAIGGYAAALLRPRTVHRSSRRRRTSTRPAAASGAVRHGGSPGRSTSPIDAAGVRR